ncbi:Uncharacterised protein [Mycobacteroides abscessus subsp. abscessus]|nr:Uncharacterised protein [Mycobacteroides abscessus subsp. abscessus]
MGFQKMQHISDGSHSQSPSRAEHFGSHLGIMSGEYRNIGTREREPRLDPTVDLHGDTARCKCPITLACSHFTQGAEADRI